MRKAEGWNPRPASSTEYVWVTVTAEAANGDALNPTSDAGQMLFQPEATVDSPDAAAAAWADAVWRTITEDELGNTLPAPEYQLGLLVGPDAYPLDRGHYTGYVKITDSPEVPIREVPDATLILT